MNHSCRQRNCDTPCESNIPDIEEMECPLQKYIHCLSLMDRNELGTHLSHYHPDYAEDPEPWFEAERERRFLFA